MAEVLTQDLEQFRDATEIPPHDWNKIVSWVRDLPPLPDVAARALALVEDPHCTASQLTALLEKDPALAARVLKIASSAIFSFQREITTLNQAIVVIGYRTLKGVIVAATLRQINRRFSPTEEMVWHNSVCTAVAAREIALVVRRAYADEAFLSGLLHDLGKLALIKHVAEDYKRVVMLINQGQAFYEAENTVFGFNHSLIGALVAKKWRFPADTCQTILHHHDPIEPPYDDLYSRIVVIQLANSIAHHLGHAHPTGYPPQDELIQTLAARLGIEGVSLDKIVERTRIGFESQSGAFS